MVQNGLSAEELMAQDAIELPEREMMQRMYFDPVHLYGVALVPPPPSAGVTPTLDPYAAHAICHAPVVVGDTPVTGFTTHTTVVNESTDQTSFVEACQSTYAVNTTPNTTTTVSSVQAVHQ